MHYFTRVLHVDDKGYLQFNFNCVYSPQKKKFHVSVLTSSPQCFHFVMELQQGRWRITEAPLPPRWIMDMEDRLARAIDSQETDSEVPRMSASYELSTARFNH